MLNRVGDISILLTGNHVLRETINKFKKSQKILGKEDSRVDIFWDKSVKIWSFFKKPYIF